MRDLPARNAPLRSQMKLLDQTLDDAERHLKAKRFSEAATELGCIWEFRHTVATRLCRNRNDEIILEISENRHRKLMRTLRWKGGIIRSFLRRIM